MAQAHVFAGKWGSLDNVGPSAPVTELNRPTGLTADSAGNVLVVDGNNFRVCQYDASGAPVAFSGPGSACIGSYGSAPGQFSHPFGIAADALGRFYVADSDLPATTKLSRALK